MIYYYHFPLLYRFESYRKYLPFKLIVYPCITLLYSNMYFWQQCYKGKRTRCNNL